jgi:hypothetical protein
VFPAIAIGELVTIPLAWKLSKHHQLPLLVSVILFPALLWIAVIPLSLVPWFVPIQAIAGTLVMVVTIAALSLSYREISKIEYGAA